MEQAEVSTEDTSVTNEQVNQYFESGGEVDAESGSEQETSNEQAAPEDNQQASQEPEQEEKKPRYVNYEALHEERMKRKEMQARVDRMEEGWNRLMQHAQQQQQQSQQPQPPSFDEDPLEHLRHQQEQQARYLQQQYQTEQQRQQNYEIEQRKQEFVNHYRAQAHEFAKQQPEFVEAYQFLSEEKMNEYLEAGFTPQEATKLLHDDEMAIVSKAFQAGINPAERLMKLAKVRGFKPADQKQQAEQKVQQMNKGVQMSKSLNGAGGKVSNEISLDAVAQMDTEEFDEFVLKNWNKIAKMVS